MKAQLCLRNGRVIDPATGTDRIMDISIADSLVVWGRTEADQTVDASGCIVIPGLIDYHAHIFPTVWDQTIAPDTLYSQGLIGAVDAGTAGCDGFDRAVSDTMLPSRMYIKAFLNVCPRGMEAPDQYAFDGERVLACLEKYPDRILGIKLLVSRGNAGIGEEGLRPLENVLEFVEKNSPRLRVCAHTTDCPVPMARVASMLRRGDILCHCYQGEANTLVSPDGEIDSAIFEARERGVLFDACPGKGNFSADVASKAINAGFAPDLIGSDITAATANRSIYCKNLLYVISKFYCLGLPLTKCIECCTSAPAEAMNEAGRLGTLAEGTEANIAVIREEESVCSYGDRYGVRIEGNRILVPEMTVCRGRIMYCRNGFAD